LFVVAGRNPDAAHIGSVKGGRDGSPSLSQNSKIRNSVKKISSTFAIWRVFILSEGVLMVFFEIFGGEFRVLRQSPPSRPQVVLAGAGRLGEATLPVSAPPSLTQNGGATKVFALFGEPH
jgi:hypothetical protein